MKRLQLLDRRITVLAAVLLLTACSKLNEENYSKLKVGMPYDEVRGVLGEPARCDDALGLRNCRWGDDNRWIRVAFVGERVAVTAANNLR